MLKYFRLLCIALPLLSSCSTVKVSFADSPVVFRGSWAGQAEHSTTKAVLSVSTRLSATYTDKETYAVQGSLALERDLPRTLVGRDGGLGVEITPQMTAPMLFFSGQVFERDTQVAKLNCTASPYPSERPRRSCVLEFSAGSRTGEVWYLSLEPQP